MQKWLIGVVTLGIWTGACVDHRPVRNGLRDESIYLDKAELTRPNPKVQGTQDDGWLYKVTVVKASSPNVVGDYAFPGLESEVRYARFRFKEGAMQLVDARSLQPDDPGNLNDDLATGTERVLLEFEGSHVDIKLRETLDGERTNQLEENFEETWEKRQKFKVDLEKTSLDPVAQMAWFYGDFMSDCADQISINLVPGSFQWDPADQYLSWVLEVNYAVNAITLMSQCYDMVSMNHDAGTATIQYRFSFYRPGPSSFQPEEIAEKDPVNKKYGSFQKMNLFRDPETGLLSAKSLLQRWNPNRKEPVVFYFHPGFPPRFRDMFTHIEAETNKILADAGASLRFAFRDHDDGGIERQFGDVRYSFVVWHQEIDTTRGLLGYGPSAVDPRTGEVLSANLNLYNVGMDYYRFLIQDFLEKKGGTKKPDPSRKWEEIACTTGETASPVDPDEGPGGERLQSALFNEMRRIMEIHRTTGTKADFIPAPARTEFAEDYHRVLGEYRYISPGSNGYIWTGAEQWTLPNLASRRATEREFQSAMHDVLMNKNPFGPVSLHSPAGIEKQLRFIEQFREWRKNHEQLRADEEMLLGLRNIYTFDAGDAIHAITRGARRCVNGFWESDEQYSQRIIEDVVFQVAIHEFGHNLSLRHNFYGSVDAKHMHPGDTSASVMDYVVSYEEAGSRRTWGDYDVAALSWIYGTPAMRQRVMQDDFLFCTDQHRSRSPLCQAHDLGVTPAQVVLNAIERYDWMYDIRNQRAFRTFWDTSGYTSQVYSAMYPLLRMWYLGIFNWGGGGIQNTLKRLDQLDPSRQVLRNEEYDAIAEDFNNDMSAAVGMLMAFFDAVINQSASFRNYQTEFDPFYGDPLRLGIIVDKLFATDAFTNMQETFNYDPNVQTYVSLYDAPYSDANAALSKRVLDDMLGSNYDTFPWFRYYALLIFAASANSNMVDDLALKQRIAIQRFGSRADLLEVYGDSKDLLIILDTEHVDNPSQIFIHEGEQYVYTYLPDRNWHLVASVSRSPVSYQFMREYNEDLKAGAAESLDDYGLKTLLAYHEYFNNFSGY